MQGLIEYREVRGGRQGYRRSYDLWVVNCMLCQRPTFDPDKRARPWGRAVSGGRLVLICPTCQVERPDWMDRLDRCDRCGGTRLSITLGEVICRQCGHVTVPRPTGDVP